MLTQKLLTLAAGLCALGAAAQPVLQNNVFPELGDQITTVYADTTGIEPGAPGANQNWDFSNLQMVAPMSPVTVQNAAATPYAADFPFANLCGFLPGDPDNYYYYYRKETSQLSNIGTAVTYGVLLQFSDPETLLQVPLDFGESFTDNFSRYNTFPDNQLSGSAHKTATYDAYGTLKIPLGTFQNAMRLHTVTAFRDTTILFAGYSINEHTDVTYEWYVPNRPMPQLSITYSSGTTTFYFPGQPPNPVANTPAKYVQFVSNLTTDASGPAGNWEGISAAVLSPNPATDLLNLHFLSEKTGLPLYARLLDADGRVLREVRMETLAGPNSTTFDVTDLPTGAYFLYLTDGKSGRTLSWQKF